MKNTMKKVLTLVLAGLMIAAGVVSVGAGTVLTDKDLDTGILNGGYIPGYYYPSWGDGEGCINPYAKCPTCGASCYQYINVVEGTIIYTYMCAAHGMVVPVAPSPDVKPVPPTGEEEDTTGDYYINTYTSRGGKITLSSSKPIKKWDSRTVYITPDYGYICTAVYVNGVYAGVLEKLELKYITKNYSIVAFFKAVDTKRDNAVVIETTGNGKVTAKLNSKNCGEVDTVLAKYKDKLTLNFTAAKNYSVKNVTINGVDMGAISSYTFEKLYYDVTVEVTYKWNNPYVDVKEHLDAVEYVTENGIMGSPNQFINTDEFQGSRKVNNYLLCAFLAEMADKEDALNEHKDRVEWAKKMEIVDEDLNMTSRPTYAEAAEIVMNFLRVVEKEYDITFTALKNVDDAKEVAKKLGFCNEKTYETGRLSRYDVAEICYAIAQLDAE